MTSEELRRPLLSRKTTRVAVESPLKTPHRHGFQSRTSHLGLTVPARLPGSRLSKLKSKSFDPEDEYFYDSTDGKHHKDTNCNKTMLTSNLSFLYLCNTT